MAAHAQTAPDSGQVLREQVPPLQAPPPVPSFNFEAPKSAPAEPGGAKVTLRAISVSGNTLFSEAQLLSALGPVKGKEYDLAGLRGLADALSAYYRQAGYIFARAYLPPQALSDGTLRIEVVEGRYGQVRVIGDTALAEKAQGFLGPLKTGEVIESKLLERTTLILFDQPGITVTPIMRPGREVGTGDLDVDVKYTKRYAGEVGVDNYGNRFTGQNQVHFNLDLSSPFTLGDQITLRALRTSLGMWFGNVGYSMPIGTSGLRGQVGYAHTYYELGKNFSSLMASGTADATTVGLSYPLIRSRAADLTISGTYKHADLRDRQDATDSSTRRSTDALPIALRFDERDGWGGGGVGFGALTFTAGRAHLEGALAASDQLSAQTQGNYQKINLDLARIQSVTQSFSLYGRMSAQWASKNLDSSEKMGLGGPNGIRAYPVGEGFGDEGWLGQFEARYQMGSFQPYAFYDAGAVKINAKPWTSASNRREIHGGGIGLRYQQGPWNVDASLAWRASAPQSDTYDPVPRAWLAVTYKF